MSLVDAKTGELVAIDPNVMLDSAADPGEFVVLCLERGKSWLAEALTHGDLDAIVNMKGYAETLRVATVQKQLGKDAELSAQELVRRAERAIGVGIRAGQEAGDISSRDTNGRLTTQNQHGEFGPEREASAPTKKPTDYATQHELSNFRSGGIYDLTDDVADEEFELAITVAKDNGNLSRANVVREVTRVKLGSRVGVDDTAEKVKRALELAAGGNTTAQIAQHLGYARDGMARFLKRHGVAVPADAVAGRQRSFDSRRIVDETVNAVNGIGTLFDRIDYSALDPDEVSGWLLVLNESIRSLTTLRNHLKEISQP